MTIIDELKFDNNGLIPAIAQDYLTNEVLMLAYMNDESLRKTIETGKANYYSRSRGKLWLKGEESGNFQLIKEIRYDCDQDAILLMVEQVGVACHTGHKSCFYKNTNNELTSEKLFNEEKIYSHKIIEQLYKIIAGRKIEPVEGSYTNYLFDKGIDKILKKVGEEAAEVIIAAKNNDKQELIYETSDLMYHLSVLMVNNGVEWSDVYNELDKRHK